MIDESTDISIVKLLGVTIRYFSKTLQIIVSTFLGLVELPDGTAAPMGNSIKKPLIDVKLDPQKLVGVGVDNASVNTGLINGVCELLKREFHLPILLMIRCVCHSVLLAVSQAMGDTLPGNVEYLVRETNNWFTHSSKRQMSYKTLYKTLNDGKLPLPLPKVCDTRWLSAEPAVSRILTQLDGLKMHFDLMRYSEKCYSAEVLFDMYNDPVNKLYLLFIRPVLQEAQHTVKAFQGENVDPTKLQHDLGILSLQLATLPTSKVNPLTSDIASYVDPSAYLGYEFEHFCKVK